MATITQPGSTQPSPPGNDSSSASLSWDGDRMFNIYIYDYCTKRGYRKTARELLTEAELGGDTVPPINARQGLLYEWWSVFWVLFSAKANNGGSEDAQIYMQHLLNRPQNQRLPPNQPMAMQQPGQQPMQSQPPPMNRLATGPNRHGSLSFGPNGPLNGAGPQSGMNPFQMPGAPPQPNGIPGQPGGPHPSGSMPPGQPPNAAAFLVPGAQRSIGAGMPPQPQQTPTGQRHPNAPFPSPTMANSPQNPSQQPGQPNPQLQQPPMSQLGPSPHLSHMNRPGGMLPMGQGMNPMNSQQQGPSGHHNPQPGGPSSNQFPQPGQTPSRSGTPGQTGLVPGGPGGNMMHPSPSMSSRVPPMPGGAGGPQQVQMPLHELNTAYANIPAIIAQQIQKELGMEGKDGGSLSPMEKQRVVGLFRSRHPQNGMNPVRGPVRNPQAPVQQMQLRGKRSPGEDDAPGRSDTSPPSPKRQRPDPNTAPQAMNSSPYPNPQQNPQQPPNQPGAPQSAMMGQNMMMGRGGPPMPMLGMGNSPQGLQQGMHPGQQPGMGGGPMGMGAPMGGMGPGPSGAGMNPGMPPGMNPSMGPPGAPGNMTPHMANQPNPQFRMAKPGGPQGMVANAQSPAAGDNTMYGVGGQLGPGPGGGPGFNQQNRMGPGPNKVMHNPSPAMGQKDPNAPGGPGGPSGPGPNSGPKGALNMESPRNPPNPASTPSTSNQPGPMGANPNPNPPPGMLVGPPGMNLNPGSMGPPPPGSQPPNLNADLFSTDFINSVASSLDEFDSGNLFRPDGDINFERDFGQWFNGDDVAGIDPMK